MRSHPETTSPPDSRGVLRALAILGVFSFVATAAIYLATLTPAGPFPRDGSTLVVGRDFLNFWMYGRAVHLPDPGRWYDAATYQRELATFLGADYPGQNWSYPPTVMLLAAPFGALGYLPALAIWSLLGITIFLGAGFGALDNRNALIAVAASPAAAFCLISGQFALIAAALLLAIFANLDRRPILAGILIGMLSVKPQLGLLFPFFLAAGGRWRVFAAATITTLALAGASIAVFGVDVWRDFIAKGLPAQNLVLADPDGIATPYFPTVFMNLRGIGLSYAAAMAAQALFAAAALAAVIWAGRYHRHGDPRLIAALFLACSVTAVPYMLAYDTLALCVVTVALLAHGKLDTRGQWIARLVYWLPLI